MAINPEIGLLWLPAFMAGLLGSGHCFAMCGGIAAGLGTLATGRPDRRDKAAVKAAGRAAAWPGALQFNLGRLAGYALAGGVLAGLVGFVPQVHGLEFLALALRLATALLVALIGLRYALGWNALDFIEKLGARLWPRIAPLASRLAGSPGAGSRLLLGLCWGFLPCGLVYTMLLTAAASANALAGASLMIVFGLGTLPSMLGLTLAAPSLSAILRDRDFRRFIGCSLVLLAAWMVFSLISMGPVTAGQDGAGHIHG